MLPSNSTEKKNITTPHHTEKSANSKLKPLRTLRQIYDMCKSYECTYKYNFVPIGQMIVDDRSSFMYPRGVFGYRIIEGMAIKGFFYNPEKLEIKIAAPIATSAYTFILKFREKELFNTIRNNIYANKDKIVIVAGEWESFGKYNVFCSDIKTQKQIVIIKQ